MPWSTSSLFTTVTNCTTRAMSSTTTEPKKWNAQSAAKAAGFSNFVHFLLSYGMHHSNPDDVEEGKAILRGKGYEVY
jgi:hypothetical protein